MGSLIHLKNMKQNLSNKKRQATYITPLQPITFAAFPPWRIFRSWLCRTCRGKYSELFDNSKNGNFKNRIIICNYLIFSN